MPLKIAVCLENIKTKIKIKTVRTIFLYKLSGKVPLSAVSSSVKLEISQIAKKNSVRAFIRIYFKENYDLLINDDPDIENQTKNYLYMLIEMIIRNREKNKKGTKYSFLKYDIIFLKFFE